MFGLNGSHDSRIERGFMKFSVGRTSTPAAPLLLGTLLTVLPWPSTLLAAPQPAVDSAALPKFPPVAARDALNTFQLRKGFRLELVAAEPLVTDPIALAFDEEGRLFVVEMNDYPERGEQRLGRVKRLEDTDGDGRFDTSTVFAKDLRFPGAIICYGGGVFVGATPDLWYFRDTDNDGVADQKQVVLTGWGNRAGKLEPEGVFNSLAWGLDNRIHGLGNRDSGVITRPDHPAAKPVTLGGNFAFDPRTLTLIAEAGGGQYGMAFNDDGRQFLCRQHSHIMTQLFDRRYADRNAHYTMPGPTVDIAVEGPKAALYRISPEEPWRVMRTKWRVAGLENGIEAGGRASGYFSAACGLTIYRGNAWPREYVGDAFVADPAENIVHHKKVMHSGPKASAERPADEKTVEFLASKDTWFRPVFCANAPDGTLYIADMYRQTIEAPVAIPEEIVKHLDLYAGNDLGRIYRIVPEGFTPPPRPRLSRASLDELVATLEHPNGWHRDTAARLLYERNDPAAASALAKLLTRSKSSLGRLHALHALKGLGALKEREVLLALSDADGVVREHAVRLSESFLQDGVPSPELWTQLSACAADPTIGVRYQLAFTLGEIRHPMRLDVLAQIVRRDAAEPMMRAAVLSSLAEGAGEMFSLLGLEASAPGRLDTLRELAAMVGAANQPIDLVRVRDALVSTRDPVVAFPLARGLGDGLRRSGSSFEKAGVDLQSLLDRAAATAADAKAPESARLEAVALLAFGRGAPVEKALLPLLDTEQPASVQLAALASLDRLSPSGLAAALLGRWPTLTLALRDKTIEVLLKRPDRAAALLDAMEAGTVQRRQLSLMQTVALRQHSDPQIQQHAIKLFAAERRVVDQKDLPRFPPVAAREALSTFQLRKGFRLELVAAEPLVTDPIAFAFDEDGRLFVIEMNDFPDRGEKKFGQVKRLEDIDGDGRFDKATVFAKDLHWPSAIHCYGGGVLVGAVPDLIFYQDTNGDGVAEQRQVVLTGWGNRAGNLDPEGVFGSLAWGLDNRIHGLVNRFSGVITNLHHPAAKPVTLGGNFAFDPRTMRLTVEAGEGQYGMGFDDAGRQFLCRQHRHIMTQLFDRQYADRNPSYTMPSPTVDIAVDGPKAALYRISPEEPWRVMRTKWRVEGLEEGIEAGGRASGYFSAACGLTIYRGNAWPREYVGDAFVADPGENIVHHKKVVHSGPKASAERPDDEKTVEFLASKDTWFRPVFCANAPDGALYIADMYREIIQAPIGIPEEILKHLDLYAGNDRGRIYRIVPEGFTQPALPRLSRASLGKLVATLEHPNGWHRDTAARLLYERNDRAAVPALVKLLTRSKFSPGRLHALYALQGLGALQERQVLPALSDVDGVVREHAVRLSEGLLQNGVPSADLWTKLAACASDPVLGVRYQLAFTLGEIRHPGRLGVLAQIARRDSAEPMMRAAVLSSLAEGAGEVFNLLASETGVPATPAGRPEILRELAAVVGAANQPMDLARVRQALVSTRDPLVAFPLARGLGDGLRRAGSSFEKAGVELESLLDHAAATAADAHAPVSVRLEAIALLAYGQGSESQKTLVSLLEVQQPAAVQSAALASLDRLSPPGLTAALLLRWSSLTPTIRDKAIDVLLKRPDRTAGLLSALETGTVQRRDLSLMQMVTLRRHSDPKLQQRAAGVLGAASDAKRDDVVRRFQPALELRGDQQRGKATFQQRCQSCHRLGSDGFAVGPDLSGARNGGREKLLTNILDPNREVPPNYFAYAIDTKEGDSYSGLVVNETANSVTVRQALGLEVVVSRAQIAQMQVSKLSLMPEGLEEGLTNQDLADLLDFIFAEDR
jgi:putative membrane-bound dehydrogenase-like protein